MDDFAALARLMDAVRPWSQQLVLVGGWAHQLYRLHDKANSPSYRALQTRDADLAFSLASPPKGDIGFALKQAGFDEELSGEHVPPVTHYTLGDGDGGFYAEFLVPLGAGATRRDGVSDATARIAGVTAQKLRHLDILLVSPWTVHVAPTAGIPITQPTDIQVPNPVSFIAQKLLIRSHRDSRKRAQDALYIHDTLDLFARKLGTLAETWRSNVRPSMSPATARRVQKAAVEQFAAVTDTIRAAARIPVDRTLAADRLQAACAYGLEEVFRGNG